MSNKNKAILKAVNVFGTQVELAKNLNVTKGRVWQWLNNVNCVPTEMAIKIEDKTNGHVRCEELRPDINWAVIRNKKATNAN